MRHGKIAALTIVLGLLCAGLFIAFLSGQDDSLDRARRQGLVVGYAVEAPFALIKPNGEVGGEAPEIARRLAPALGIAKVIFRQSQFGNLIEELRTGKIDVIAAGMFITPDRAELIAFSDPTLHVAQGLLVTRGNPLGLHSYEQLPDWNSTRAVVLTGSIEESLLLRLGLPAERLLRVPDALTGRVAVESGQADALALSAITTRCMVRANQLGRTEVAEPFTQPVVPAGWASGYKPGYAAFAFRKEDKALLADWNIALRSFRGGPAHLAIMKELGLSEADLPGNATVETILKP